MRVPDYGCVIRHIKQIRNRALEFKENESTFDEWWAETGMGAWSLVGMETKRVTLHYYHILFLERERERQSVYPGECLISFDFIRKYFHNRLTKIYGIRFGLRSGRNLETCFWHWDACAISDFVFRHTLSESGFYPLWSILYSTARAHSFIDHCDSFMHTNDFQLNPKSIPTASPTQSLDRNRCRYENRIRSMLVRFLRTVCVRAWFWCVWTRRKWFGIFLQFVSHKINPLYNRERCAFGILDVFTSYISLQI